MSRGHDTGMFAFDLQLHAAMFGRLLVVMALGSLVGCERAGKPAGVRTHGMVALGAALFTVVSIDGFGAADPARVAAQVEGASAFSAPARFCTCAAACTA